MPQTMRTRADVCPGVLRPWPADDGPLVRIRLLGGLLTRDQLAGLVALAGEHSDGNVHLTKRANVQLRAVREPDAFAAALEGLGLLPSRSHELVRNIVVSPQSDALRPLAARFDDLLCADPALAGLPARFLFAFDDRGDLATLTPDLGVLADTTASGRLVVGGRLGPAIALRDVPTRLVDLARRFLSLRGEGPTSPWHVTELPEGLSDQLAEAPDSYVGEPDLAGQLDVPEGVLTPDLAASLPSHSSAVVTPWRGLVLR